MQQIVVKKNAMSTDISGRDMKTGLLLSEDKNGQVSDREMEALMVAGLDKVVEEFSKAKADAMESKDMMYNTINNVGMVKLSDIETNADDSLSRNLLNTYLLGIHVDSNLVNKDGYLPHTLEQRKRHMKAIRIVKDMGLIVHFDWYGDKKHHPAYYSKIEKLYGQLDISDYLTLHEQNQKIEEEYRKADVFCLPSLYEGYPNVIAEAMACGLPVICSNVYENPYIIEDGINGFLFNPEQAEDIVSAIKRVLSLSQKERRQMGARNRQLCLSRNTEDAFLKSYVGLIEGV